MKGKYGMLMVLLGVPVITYLFLVGFGRNHYDLPKFFPLGTSEYGDTSYYVLSKEVKHLLGVPSDDSAAIIWLHDDSSCTEVCANASWSRIQDQVSGFKDITLVRTSKIASNIVHDAGPVLFSSRTVFDEHYFVKGTSHSCNRLCLIDSEGRVRGLYNACSREELDRLFLEVKVLNYKQD